MEDKAKKIKGITFTKKDGTKTVIPIKAIIYSIIAWPFGTGMILTLNQSPANSHTISRTSWLMMATFVLGYLGAGSYISSLVLLTKYNPKKESGQVGGSIEQTTNPKGS